jgi:GntR family transcriptional regulator/MocR family aminotransferase
VPAWQAFQVADARDVHIPVDAHGLQTDFLEARAKALRGRLKAVYVTPHHQYPTSVSLSAERRMHLLQLAERFAFTIIEDDYDYEYHFDGAPLLPLSAALQSSSRCVYVASLSKLLAPAIRLGYVVASDEVVARLKKVRAVLDRQGDVVLERAIAEAFEDGVIQRHARRARRLYKVRRDHLLGELQAHAVLDRALEYSVPSGGLALWMRLRRGAVEPVVRRAHAAGILLTPGSAHLPAGKLAAFRFGFAAYTPAELSRICEILALSFGAP